MPKSAHRPRRRNENALQVRDQGRLVDRLLDTPQLARVIPQLQPELLHQIVQRCGLEDCGELLALATPAQLERVLDLDLWRRSGPGGDEQFDADRFGVWLEVLVDAGPQVAAQKLSHMNVDLVAAGIARHARVYDRGAATPYTTLEGEVMTPVHGLEGRLTSDIGGYLLVATRTDSWEAIVAASIALEAEYPACFNDVMEGCVVLSNPKPEVDGLDDLLDVDEQAEFDVAFDREQRREKQGYVTPAQAQAFLQMSREPVGADRHSRANPIATAYFRALDQRPARAQEVARLEAGTESILETVDESAAEAVAAVVDVLLEAGVIAPPRALLTGASGNEARLDRIHAHLQYVLERDPIAYAARNQELGFLTNTIASGATVLARPLSVQEASDAAHAVCNLGLEHWPAAEDLLATQELVGVFQAGWRILYNDVCMHAAEHLLVVLAEIYPVDSDIQDGLRNLRMNLTKHWRAGRPWLAREAMEVIGLLDMPAWAALAALIDEFPVMHAGIPASRARHVRTVGASDFEFISTTSQIRTIRDFMTSLPERLR